MIAPPLMSMLSLIGIALGQHPTVIARSIAKGLNGGMTRVLLISQTEILRSYRESSRLTYLAVVPIEVVHT